MTAVVHAGRRLLPRGWRDFAFQLLIWFGFLFAYQIARGFGDRNPTRAFENGLAVVNLEERMGRLFELTLQQLASSSHVVTVLVSWTYWNSEFTVVGLSLLYVYVRRNDAFTRFRNWILLANLLGLVGYVALPTAPPRMFSNFGFTDTLAQFGGLNHGSGIVQLAANPYAAMPSLHAADALIVGITLFSLSRRHRILRFVWLAWPLWVWFSVMATANHFWLDIVAGDLVALLAALVVHWAPSRRLGRRRATA